ncbi:MAG: LytTR family DNA-binding domain-containing protein [Firmicutes bacterium]|nr:LytTR family DNA-binding domain-containing protein [Bacillota bacterium]
MSLRVVLADDEPLARKRLGRLLREAGCEVLEECAHGAAVLEWFATHREADALFLDIQMPGLTGLEVLAELKDPPPVVFVTAHIQYAIQAFEAAAVDYLLKPVSEDRLAKTLERLHHREIPRRKGPELAALLPNPAERFPVRAGEGFVFLDLRKVTHFEVCEEVVYAWAGGERYRTSWTSLAEVETAFPGDDLLRIHRHLLVRPASITGFKPLLGGRGEVRVAGGKTLEVSRGSVPKLRAILGLHGKSEN